VKTAVANISTAEYLMSEDPPVHIGGAPVDSDSGTHSFSQSPTHFVELFISKFLQHAKNFLSHFSHVISVSTSAATVETATKAMKTIYKRFIVFKIMFIRVFVGVFN